MRELFLDFESYYENTSGLSLKNQKVSMTDYVRHEDFAVHGFSFAFGDDEPQFIRSKDTLSWLHSQDWSEIELIAHNALFEAIVLREIYGLIPARLFCTMAAAEAQLQGACNSALNDLAIFFGLGEKLPDLDRFKNKRTDEFTEEDWQILARYANNDVQLTMLLYEEVKVLPVDERELLNITLMLFADPVLHVDLPLAQEAYDEALHFQQEAVQRTGLAKSDISGNNSFAALLGEALGGDHLVPQKWSKAQEKLVPALAKTDTDFVQLRYHESEMVRALVDARLAVKSTQPITRAQRLIDVGTTGTCLLPVCLHYGRAHTLRWTAGNKLNLQNLKRRSKLRRAIVAPDGYVIVVVDSAQIEARMLAWLANESQLLDAFRDPTRDPYAEQAEKVYNRPISKESDPIERFVGKVCVLGLGYGMGVNKLHHSLLSGAMGDPVDVNREFAKHAVDTYRGEQQNIVGFWPTASQLFRELVTEGAGIEEFKFLSVNRDQSRIEMPNMFLKYTQPGFTEDGGLKYYSKKGKNWVPTHTWGGAITENIIQKLARDVVAHQALAIAQRYRVVLLVHDEVAFLAKKDEADEALAFGINCLRRAPDWCSDLPLDAEGGYDTCYSK